MDGPPPLDERSAEAVREARDHRDAGRLVRDPALQKEARRFLAAVAARAMASKTVVTAHAVHLGAAILVDNAAQEAAQGPAPDLDLKLD